MMALSDTLPDARAWHLPEGWMLPPCPFGSRDEYAGLNGGPTFGFLPGPHDFDAHTVEGLVMSQNCRRCGLILPLYPE